MAGLFSLFSRKKKQAEPAVQAETKQEEQAAAVPAPPAEPELTEEQEVPVQTEAAESAAEAAAEEPAAEKTEEAAAAVSEKDEPAAEKVVEKAEAKLSAEDLIEKAHPEESEDDEVQEEVPAEAPAAQEDPAAQAAKKPQQDAEKAEEAVKEEKESFFSKLWKTRASLTEGLSALLKGRVIDDDLYEELETSLLMADLGIETTNMVIAKLREEAKLRELHDAALLKKRLQQILTDLLRPCEAPLDVTARKPFVILMVGVNGAGKTTTIGKLARKYKDQGLKVMLAAGDTFRAAAVEQLKEWGKRAEVPVISQPTGSDSASVLFDALTSARSRGMDVLICDTAGRLQNKSQLMEELKKIVRVLKKQDEAVPHEVLLVLDASTGQNAVSQTKLFSEAAQVTGLCLTKLDGTAKGGVIFALADKFKLPLRFVGLGEKAEDLREFKAEPFVEALLREDNNADD